jgi:hypothetical protein
MNASMISLGVGFALASLVVVTGCTLQGSQGSNIGVECNDASDCDDKALGCVPIDEENPASRRICLPPAEDWTCAADFYGDGACDCGCNFKDVDCPDLLASSCSVDGNNCAGGKSPSATDNTKCE